ncbi:MAG: hypothetical protein TEF_03410 [Rhizobiales bacterium NRL2]|nr:MAG: hypothetical protein TEF_03410 [Rhizobiales bacterium NRL2]
MSWPLLAAADEVRDLEAAREDRAAAAAEAEALERDAEAQKAAAAKLSAELAETAGAVRGAESRLSGLEREIEALEARRAELDASLAARREQMAASLSALTGIARVPPLAVIARPGAFDRARLSASALAGLRPALERRMAAITDDMRTLAATEARLASARSEAENALSALENDRARLAELVAARRAQAGRTQEAAETAQARAAELGRKVRTLEDLVSRLGDLEPVAAPEGRRTAEAMAAFKGRLPLPAEGRVVSAFGEQRGANDGKGMAITTRSGAVVTVPHDAIVRFAGDFRSYGRLLILDFGDSYHLLVAGLSGIDVVVGQWLLAGEPVGRMAVREDGGRPELYLELRHDGLPIDPGPWLAQRQGKTSG